MNESRATTSVADYGIEESIARAAEQELRLDDLQRLSNGLGVDLRSAMDAFAQHVAEHYASEAWTFDYCYRAMNGLFAVMRESKQCPDRAFAVFFAFCAGHGNHKGGSRGPAAEDRFTRPMIARIVPGRVARRHPQMPRTPNMRGGK